MRYWRARADSQSLGCPPLADRHRGLGADRSNPTNILDSEETATTINFGNCRLRCCVNGGSRAKVERYEGTEGGRTW